MERVKRAALFGILLFTISCSKTRDPQKSLVIAKIDGRKIYESDLLDYYSDSDLKTAAPNVKRKLLLNMIMDIVVSDEIKNVKIDDEEFRDIISNISGGNYSEALLETVRKVIMLKRYLKETSDIRVSDEEIADYYKKNESGFITKEAVLVYQLFFKDRATAEKVIRSIKGDVNRFKELSLVHNEEPYKSKNGLLGWVEHGDLPFELEEAVFSVKEGQFTKLVPSEYGFHYFYIEKKIGSSAKTLEEASDNIRRELFEEKLNERYDALVKKLLETKHISINEVYIYR